MTTPQYDTTPRMTMFSRRIRLMALVAAVCAAAGCAAVDGTPAAGEIDVRTLDVGTYPTEPLDMRYTYYNDLSAGTKLAVMRLAGQVANGLELDDRFTYATGTLAITDAESATKLLADVTQPILETHRLLYGYAVGHASQDKDENDKTPRDADAVTMTVLQFPSEAAAAAAAQEIEAADFAVAAAENEPVTLSKYPEAHAHWRPGVASLGTAVARSNYVVNLLLRVRDPDLTQLTALTEKVLDAQLPLLDQLPPLSREDILRLEYDTDGMLRRTLNPDGFGSPDTKTQFVVGARGFLHLAADQRHWSPIMAAAGVDRFAVTSAMSSASMLFRTRDTEAADDLVAVILDKAYPEPADAPAGIPHAVCGESPIQDDYDIKRFRCAVSYRRYVATVESDQLADAHQRAAAQYATLANSW